MRGPETSGKNTIEEVAALRARMAELERVNRRLTKNRNAEEDLDRAWTEWEKTFDAARDSIMVLDGDFKIAQANIATSQFFGKPLEEIIGQPCWKIVQGTNGSCRECPLKVAQNTMNHEEAELYLSKRDIWIEVSVDPILDDRGRIEKAIHIVRDITERRRAREREKQYIRELEFLSESAAAFAQFPVGADLYGYIAGRLKELVPDAIVIVNSYERESGGLRVRELLGLGGKTEAVIKLMGANPVGKCFEIDDQAREGLARGQLEKIPGGIYDLSPGIPKAVCQAIEKLLGLGDVYGTGLSWKGELLGSIIILTRSRDELKNRILIETFIRQAAVALQRAEAERALQESEKRLETAIDAASLGTWDWNLTTGHIVGAGHHDRFFGFAPGEFDGRYETFESRIHPDDLDGLRQAVERSLQERVDYAHEYRVIWPDGTMRWIAGRGRYCWDQMGRPTRMLGVVSDVTDRKRAEEAYRSLVDHSLQGLAIFQDGCIVFANRAMAKITGYTVEEMLASSFEKVQAFVHPDDREIVWDRHRRRLQGELLPEQYELRGIRKDGSIRWLAIDASTVVYQGRPAIQAAYVDITERKMAKEALLKSEEELKAIFEGAVDGIVYADRRGYVIEVNPAFAEITGIPREQVVGKHGVNLAKQFAKPKDIPRLLRAISDVLRGKPVSLNELEINNKIVEIATPSLTKETAGITAVLRDVTERKRAEDALRQSEKKFRSLFNNAEVGMFRSRLDGSEFLESNDKYLSILGMTREEVIGKPTTILWADPKDREEMVNILKDESHVNSFECRLLNKAGEVINCLVSLRLYPETGLLEGSIVDITERIKAEDKIRLFSDAINSAFDCFILTDEKGNITYVNATACRMFGYTHEEFLKLKVTNLNADPAVAKKIIKEIAANGKWSGEVTNISKNGETFSCLLSSFIIKDDKGNPKGTMGILRDITERKKVVKALEESEQRLRILFECAPDGIYLSDLEGNFIDGNRVAEELTGYAREELIGRNLAEAGLLWPDDIQKAVANLGKLAAGQPTGPDEYTLRRKDGTEVVVEVRAYPVRINSQILSLGIARDITERKKARDALRESEEKHRLLLEHAGCGIGYYDLSGRVVLFNREALKQFGGEAQDYIGKKAPEVFRPELGRIILDRIAAAAKSAAGHQYEDQVDLSTGRKYFVSTYNRVIDAPGNCIGVQIISHEITARKKMENALRENRGLLNAVLNSAPITIFAMDSRGVFTLHKGKATQTVGMKSGENVGVSAFELYESLPFLEYPDRATTGGCVLRRVLKGETVAGITELRGTFFDNQFAPILDVHGRVVGAVGVATDISNRVKAEHLLRKERDKAQQYLDVTAVMMVAVDSEQRVGLINKKGCEILGYEEEEVLGRNWFDNFLPDRGRNEVRTVFEMFLRGQADAPEYFENFVLTRDGRERLIAWNNTTVRDENGNFVAVLSSGEDITEHKRIIKALEQSEEKYRDLFEHARDTIVTFDPEGNITDANKAVEEYGFKREELMGKSLFDFVIEEHRAKAAEDFETLIGGRSVRGEMDIITPKGTITIEYSDNPIIRGKHVVGIQAILTDITERKEAERALRESEERLKILFESTPYAIYLNDLEGCFVDGNNAAEELSGFKRGELVGKNFTEVGLLSSDEIPKAVANLERIAAGQTVGPDEFTLTKTDGSRVMVEIRSYPVQINNQTLSLGIAHDITKRKEAEERLLEYQAKLKAMASEILRVQDRERKRIATGLHDNICQNLVLTKVLLQSTLRLVSDPSVSGPLKMACEAMSDLIEQADSLMFELSNPVLRQLGLVVALKKHLAEEVQKRHGIAFELEGDDGLNIPHEEIKNSLFRISRELLMNVVKHAQARNVKVSIHERHSWLRIVIQDDGVGFDSGKVHSEVFRTSRFGLFSIREQLEHLGGTFAIESEPGRGTTATVVVPLREDTLGEM
jgi:PAS domain S-box-containing protein